MKRNQLRKTLVIVIITLIIGASIVPIISGISINTNTSKVNELSKNQDTSPLTFYTFDKTGLKECDSVLPVDVKEDIVSSLEVLKDKIVNEPLSKETKILKSDFVDLLDEHNLFPVGFSKDKVLSLLNPFWLRWFEDRSGLNMKTSDLMSFHNVFNRMRSLQRFFVSREVIDLFNSFPGPGSASAILFFCSIASGGRGIPIPLFLLPRPRGFVLWSGSEGCGTNVNSLLLKRGFIAGGTQNGFALGFYGVGLTYSLFGETLYAFIGYSTFTFVNAKSIQWYVPPNEAPKISDESPVNGAKDVSISLSELSFRITDAENNRMSYTVTTSPDIGSGSGSRKKNGVYSVPVSGLMGNTEYSWHLVVKDKYHTVERTFSFTTEAVSPVVSDLSPVDGDDWVPVDISELSFRLKDFQGDSMDFSVETVPDVGSGSGSGVGDGVYSVDVSGLDYTTVYSWFVNVTDGTYWTRDVFSFKTQPIMVFDPFDEGWLYRKKITIDHDEVEGDLSEFPVLVSVVDSDLKNKAQVDGDDVLFMDGSGVASRLFHEIELYDGSSGELVAWVNVSNLDGDVDTVFYMYYGNSDCDSQQYPEKVWDSDYKLVYHLDETSGHHQDSTANNADSTAESVTVQGSAAGKIGGADEFERDNTDYVAAPNVGSLNTFTLEIWAKYESYVKYEELMGKEKYIAFVTGYDDGHLTYGVGDGEWGNLVDSAAGAIETGNWYYIVGTSDGTNIELFIDSDSKGTAENSDNFNADFHLGERYANKYNFDGIIDEVRVSDIERSQDWITTTYNTINDPSSFFSMGPEESAP